MYNHVNALVHLELQSFKFLLVGLTHLQFIISFKKLLEPNTT